MVVVGPLPAAPTAAIWNRYFLPFFTVALNFVDLTDRQRQRDVQHRFGRVRTGDVVQVDAFRGTAVVQCRAVAPQRAYKVALVLKESGFRAPPPTSHGAAGPGPTPSTPISGLVSGSSAMPTTAPPVPSKGGSAGSLKPETRQVTSWTLRHGRVTSGPCHGAAVAAADDDRTKRHRAVRCHVTVASRCRRPSNRGAPSAVGDGPV